jgi:ABC-type glycerol-3-phosphate transport system substrate-binding protein
MTDQGLTRCSRRAWLAVPGAASAALLAACGEVAPRSADAPAPAREPVTVKVLSPTGYLMEDAQDMMPSWDAANPLIKVQIGHTADVVASVIAGSAAGGLDDILIAFMGSKAPQLWFVHGITVPLDAHVRTNRLNAKDWYKFVWDAHFLEGKQFSLPWQGQVYGFALYYNKNVFDERGMAYPDESWTLDRLADAAEKLKVTQGNEVKRWGLAYSIPNLATEGFVGYTRAFNAELFSENQREFVGGTTPQLLTALNWYTEMMQRRHGALFSPGGHRQAGGEGKHPGSREIMPELLRGNVAMVGRGWLGATGPAGVFLRDNPQARYGLTLQPKGPTGRRGGWVTSAASSVTRLSRHPDEAFRFLVAFTGRDWSVARGLPRTPGASATLNGRPDVYNDPRLQQDPLTPRDVALARAKTMDETERENCSHQGDAPWNFRVREYWEALGATVEKINTGEAPASQDMVDQLRRLMAPLMALERPRLQS